ncbi:MAG TPA: hypothetical protein DIT59_14260, partial [Leclercia sp.]|nr:hypothetical protein [Leclercia sp.]
LKQDGFVNQKNRFHFMTTGSLAKDGVHQISDSDFLKYLSITWLSKTRRTATLSEAIAHF